MIKQLTSVSRYFFNLQVNHKVVGLTKFQHQAKFPVLELVDVPTLTQQDILNFDQFYNTQTVSEFREFKGKRVLIKKVYQPNIGLILELKIGDKFENLINFLEQREDSITDIELAYCLITIKKHHRHYLPPLAKTYLVKINNLIEIGMLKFYSVETLRDILEVHNCSNFLDEPAIIICIDYLLKYTQHMERKIEQREEIDESHHSDELSLVYRTLLELCSVEHKKNHAFECLMKIRKVLTRKLNLLPIQDIVGLLHLSSKVSIRSSLKQHKDTLFTEVSSIQKMEDFILQNYNVLDMQEKIYSLKSLAQFPLQRSAFAEKFYLEVQKNNETMTLDVFATLNLAFSSFTFTEDVQATFWIYMQQKFLTFQIVEEDHHTFSKIIQIFGQNSQGTLEFWKQIQNTVFKQNNYADDFTLLQNLLRLGSVDSKLIDNLTQQELSGKEFKYLNKYTLEQRISVIQTFTQSYHALPILSETHLTAFNMLMNQMKQLIFNNDNDRDDIYKDVYMRLKYVLILNMALDITKRNDSRLEKQKYNIAQELQLAQRKIDRLIGKGKLNTYESLVLYAILCSRQDKNARLLDLLSEHIDAKLQHITNFDEILKVIQLAYQTNVTQTRFWMSVLKKVHSIVETFQMSDLVVLRNILKIHLKELDELSYLELSMIQICNQRQIPLYLIKNNDIPYQKCENLDDLLKLLMREI